MMRPKRFACAMCMHGLVTISFNFFIVYDGGTRKCESEWITWGFGGILVLLVYSGMGSGERRGQGWAIRSSVFCANR